MFEILMVTRAVLKLIDCTLKLRQITIFVPYLHYGHDETLHLKTTSSWTVRSSLDTLDISSFAVRRRGEYDTCN